MSTAGRPILTIEDTIEYRNWKRNTRWGLALFMFAAAAALLHQRNLGWTTRAGRRQWHERVRLPNVPRDNQGETRRQSG